MPEKPDQFPLTEVIHELKRVLGATDDTNLVRDDLTTRLLYSTDASIYQIEPLGVVFPRQADDLQAIMETCGAYGVPVLPRGSGSSLAGQAVGQAMIVDCSRYLNHLLEIDVDARTARVEPGLVLNALNLAGAAHGLQFGPDPASSERATLGGCIANNASGAHSILYGMTSDHIHSAEVVLADGSLATFEKVNISEVKRKIDIGDFRNGGKKPSIEEAIYRAALDIRERDGEVIRQNWPRTWRNASGYPLNYLLPWSPSKPNQWEMWGRGDSLIDYPPVTPDTINLAPLLGGSEGTLAIIKRATIHLVPVPPHTILGVMAYPGIAEACEAVPGILEFGPSAVELIPQDLIRLARSVPAYAQQLGFLDALSKGRGDPAAILVVEFAGNSLSVIKEKINALDKELLIAEDPAVQQQVWAVRKVGLALVMSRAGDIKPWSFIEDLSVPVDSLGEFVRGMEHIFDDHGVQANFYGHASAGCLHIRPMINLKLPQGLATMRLLAAQAVALTLRLGGSVSGEHGDGLSRSGWLELQYGREILAAFRELKKAADPRGLLNPGKIVPVEGGKPPMVDENLRFGSEYHIHGWHTALDFSSQAGLVGAVEQCNGAGVCRKAGGVMCPSFQATQDEMHSTRGRANLLRAMLSGRFPTERMAEKTVYEALDLCLACKGCKAECPSAVDMAKLKYEFMNQYYQHHPRKLRDYFFGYIGTFGRLGSPFAEILNPLLGNAAIRNASEKLLGLAGKRPFPRLAKQPLQSLASRLPTAIAVTGEKVLFLSDAFTEYFRPQVGLAALRVLKAAGCQVIFIPVIGAGRTFISKGFLEVAKQHARKVVEAVSQLDPGERLSIVGVEPSEIVTLRDEYADLLPGDGRIESLRKRAFLIDEFMVRPEQGIITNKMRIANIPQKPHQANKPKILLHIHCHQKSQPPNPDGHPSGSQATVAMLEMSGYQVKVIEDGCCGVAGAFGYEAEHYDLSKKIGEIALLPAVRQSEQDVILATSGVSCQAQIEEGMGKQTFHPIQLVEKMII